jgi:hypothetical protein
VTSDNRMAEHLSLGLATGKWGAEVRKISFFDKIQKTIPISRNQRGKWISKISLPCLFKRAPELEGESLESLLSPPPPPLT